MKFQVIKTKNQILPIIAVLAFLAISLIPFQAAQALDPLVPCGTSSTPPCTFCHAFVLINNILRLIFFTLAPSIAILMFIIGGFYLLTAAGRPDWFNKAKNIMTAAVIGLVIIFVALLFLNTLLDALGVVEWTKLKGNWWSSEWWGATCRLTP
ncbi:MAG: hypothetical protein HY443_01530 [Candidatus Nealsonbacteria bacterium]|nr:hypothetical protein [Candidatus Nealsonbacteria bacterium]